MISSQLQIITEEIVRVYGKVDSIILRGGFGRGEGTVRRLPSGKVVPFKDYDLYVVTRTHISDRDHFQLLQAIHKRLGIDPNWYFSVEPGDFNVDIEEIHPNKLERLPPDISTVDAKLASRILYGEDLRDRITVSAEDIALASGAVVLLNKVTGLLENLNPDYLRKAPEGKNRDSLLYECGKTYVELCTALLILDGRYSPLYRERAQIFKEIYAQRFRQLQTLIPELAHKVEYFTYRKLESSIWEEDLDPVEFWFLTRRDFGLVVRYYLNRLLAFEDEGSTWSVFADEFYRRAGFSFFLEYLDYDLRHTSWFRRPMLPWISFLGQIYLNMRFVSRKWGLGRGIYLTPVLYWRAPIIKIFAASLLAMFSIERNGQIDIPNVRKAAIYLKQIYPFEFKDSWADLRNSCVEAQKSLRKSEKTVL
jgi:hypothetical protein